MSSENANSSSICRQNRWDLAIDTYFSKDHVVEIDDRDLEATMCVFRLPKTTTDTKPEAYAPRRLGLGPYHPFRPEFDKMQLHKISRVRSFLGPPEKLEAFNRIVADLVKREPVVRACYDEYLDFDMKTLARILAVDGLYLLHLLRQTKDGKISDEIIENAAADILMVENQIPALVFKVILEVLQAQEIISSAENVLSTKFREFCEAHSPLELDKAQWESMDTKQLHLLDRLYHSIAHSDQCKESDTPILRLSGGKTPSQIEEIVERAKKLTEHFKGGANVKLAFTTPTASELSKSANVQFKHTPRGIRDIWYNADENSLQLPSIRIDGDSEIVLRNLVAYEVAASAAAATTFKLAEYLDLMCGLIRSDKDVIILKKAEIIKGEVSEEGVVGVFDEIGRLMGDSRKKQPKFVVDDVSDEVWSVKVKRCANKCLNVVWRFVILVAAVLVVAVLVMQAFCSVFACGRGLGSRAALQGFNYQ